MNIATVSSRSGTGSPPWLRRGRTHAVDPRVPRASRTRRTWPSSWPTSSPSGLGGMFALGIGATLYVSADLHDEWRKLERIEDAILRLRPELHRRQADLDAKFEAMVAPGRAASALARRGNAAAASSGAGAARRAAHAAAPAWPPCRGRCWTPFASVRLVAGLALLGLMLAWCRAAEAPRWPRRSPRPRWPLWCSSSPARSGPRHGREPPSSDAPSQRCCCRLPGRAQAHRPAQKRQPRRGPDARATAGHPGRPVRARPRLRHAPGCEQTRAVALRALPEGILPCAICTPRRWL